MQGTHISSGGNTTGASLLLDLFDDDKNPIQAFYECPDIFGGYSEVYGMSKK